MRVAKSKYLKAAKYRVQGCSEVDALVKAKVMNKESALKSGYLVFRRDYMQAEMERLKEIEDAQFALSKAEKLEQNANLMRGLYEKLNGQIKDEKADIDNKAVDSFVKLGKRDDQLQGHQVMAETNPQDKADALLADWVMEMQRENEANNEIKLADAIDIDAEEV